MPHANSRLNASRICTTCSSACCKVYVALPSVVGTERSCAVYLRCAELRCLSTFNNVSASVSKCFKIPELMFSVFCQTWKHFGQFVNNKPAIHDRPFTSFFAKMLVLQWKSKQKNDLIELILIMCFAQDCIKTIFSEDKFTSLSFILGFCIAFGVSRVVCGAHLRLLAATRLVSQWMLHWWRISGSVDKLWFLKYF